MEEEGELRKSLKRLERVYIEALLEALCDLYMRHPHNMDIKISLYHVNCHSLHVSVWSAYR